MCVYFGITAVSAYALLRGDRDVRNDAAIGLFPMQIAYKVMTIGLVPGGISHPVVAWNAGIALHHAIAFGLLTANRSAALEVDDAKRV
jgi:hypothetical protein